MKILVVDDGQLAINSLIRILCRVAPDCDYISAMTTDDALNWLRQGPMDVAFLNLEMPGMNGLALARSGALPRLKEQYGIRCQVNAATVLEGGFFQRRKLDRWLKDGLVDAISSDAHNCTTRATRMQAAYERLCGILGQPDADALTGRNNALLLTP